ncbi:hypothetical protein RHMOL_Rhmol07G0185500 [Rhododendron molle]|uniref:Uncharacterized protein n=1 Tax=Rhododendron molle TaxID=49168 RepID=A0ACC0N3B4_RHOML|nr:hypothetical protein RHMOL_Rhmol07G0185500 [Rhododendron molle]
MFSSVPKCSKRSLTLKGWLSRVSVRSRPHGVLPPSPGDQEIKDRRTVGPRQGMAAKLGPKLQEKGPW